MINTKLLMTASGGAMGLMGLALTFLPEEIAAALAIPPAGAVLLFLQLMGALYLAHGLLNWIAKGNPMGGIYGRPIGLTNLAHFTIGGLALAKGVMSGLSATGLIALTAVYLLFAVLFVVVIFGPPPFARDA